MKHDKVAFFDICGTLYKENTTFSFIDTLEEDNLVIKNILNSFLLKAISAIVYKLTNFDLLKKIKINRLKNKNVKEIELLCLSHVANKLTKRKEVFDILDMLKNDNYKIILVSATIEPIAKSIAQLVGDLEYYSTSLSKIGEHYTGTVKNELYHKKYKIVADVLASNEYRDSIFITDNVPDLQACKLCERALAIVNNERSKYFWVKNDIEVLIVND